MPLSWNEIRTNAIAFAHEWAGETRERAEAQTFWNEFFAIFGLRRKHLAAFEEPVRKLSGEWGYIDLFWPGTMLVEHKSEGADLSQANSQAMDYVRGLIDSHRRDEAPRFILISDFRRMVLYDLDLEQDPLLPLLPRPAKTIEFPLNELYTYIHAFAFIPGYEVRRFGDEAPINIEAAERLGALRDALEQSGYRGHALERLLVRLLFCLFADKTGIFQPRDLFASYVENHTRPDGADLGPHLEEIFETLDTPSDKRSKNMPEELRGTPYVNGGLFTEQLRIAHFDRQTRNALLHCSRFDWSAISPAIFGALFQSVLDKKERRQIGAHYTTERDIMKVVRASFLDELRTEFERVKNNKSRLRNLHRTLSSIRVLDPACGCGNFLVVSYRELRLLEIDIIKALDPTRAQLVTDISQFVQVDVDQFYGIEIEEWPVRIAEVAMWLMDHQMNLRVAEFGQYFQRLPLTKSPTIRHGNALLMDWNKILPAQKCTVVLGNPPFVGKKEQTAEQKVDLEVVWGDRGHGIGVLDYVTCWYKKAAEYMKGTRIRAGFVSTNSISQGEQVGVLWSSLFGFGLKIHFAHTTFEWQSEARGKAHVHVVIIGFGAFDVASKVIFEYDTPGGSPHAINARNINPYLADAPDVLVTKRMNPINGAPEISYGSMMIDKPKRSSSEDDDDGDAEAGGLIISDEERRLLINECPQLKTYIRRIMGGKEFLHDLQRWCLWLVDAPPVLLKESPRLYSRIEAIKRFRRASGRKQTQKLAETPTLFGEIRQPSTEYLIIPKVSSQTRRYIPVGFIGPKTIASGSALIVPNASLYDFGIISSAMHNAWMRYVGGRTKSDYQYSNQIVYNNFVWPDRPTPKQREVVVGAAEAVLAARSKFPALTPADLYEPVGMPPILAKAHAFLDRAVERCYRKQPFETDRHRVEYLFALLEGKVSPLAPTSKRTSAKRH